MYTSYMFYTYTFSCFRMTIATRGQTVGLDSADNQTNVQVSTRFYTLYYNSSNIDTIDLIDYSIAVHNNYLKIKLLLFTILECFPTKYTNPQCVVKHQHPAASDR